MKKRIFAWILGAVMLLTACAGGKGSDQTQKTGSDQDAAAIKIGVLRVADSLPVYVGDEKGLFAENGAQVELVEFGSASDQSKAMESGAIDGMMTDMVVQALIQKGGVPMRTVATALGATVEEGKFLVVAGADAGISSVSDMKGKSVAISEGTMMEYLVDSYCKELGIDISTLNKVNIPSLSLRYETLMSGEVDMAILPDPMGDLAVSNGAKTVIDDTTLKNNFSCSVIAFNQEFLEKHTEAVENFLKGYSASIDRINEKNQEDFSFIASVANVPESMESSWTVPSFTSHAVPSKEQVEDLMQWMHEKGLIDTEYTYEEMVDPSAYQEVE